MNTDQMSAGYKRSLQGLRLKLATLLFLTPFPSDTQHPKRAGTRVQNDPTECPRQYYGHVSNRREHNPNRCTQLREYVPGYVGIFISRWQIYQSRLVNGW
jgi:hypothetical protein